MKIDTGEGGGALDEEAQPKKEKKKKRKKDKKDKKARRKERKRLAVRAWEPVGWSLARRPI